MTMRTGVALLTAIAGSLLLPGASAFAQTAPVSPADMDSGLQEIIVTANKREERLQDVAMSLTAISGPELDERQVLDLQDLANTVPGLNVQQGGNAGVSTRLILRGLNTGNSGATVASMVDDIPFSLSGTVSDGADFATDFDSYDLNRIEVLRGPQGSLYGATAEGGLIKYVTNAPDPRDFHAGYEVGALDLEHGGAGGSGKGYVNLPMLNGTAALRFSGYYEYSPGWIGNDIVGKSDVNSFKRYGGRLSWLWNPSDDLSIRTTAFIQDKIANDVDTLQVNGFQNPANPFGLLKGYNDAAFLLQPNDNHVRLYAVDINYDLHVARFQSISSYGTIYQNFATDSSYYAYFNNATNAGIFGRPNTALTEFGNNGMEKYSQELRLSSEPGSSLFAHPFDWQVGAFYTHEQAAGLSHYLTRDYPSGAVVDTPLSPTSAEVFYTNQPSIFKEVAGYADVTYHFTPAFDVEAGGRVFNSKEDFGDTEGGALFGFPISNLGTGSSSDTSETFSVAPRYHLTPDDLVYVRIASGYRPGGPEPIIPDGPAGLPKQFGSDRTVNYEVGFKGLTFDHTLTLDVDAFLIDWTKVQVTELVELAGQTAGSGAAYTETLNVGSAKSKGFEWSAIWTPISGLSLNAVGAYTDAKLTADATGSGAHSGDFLPYVSKIDTTLGGDYEWRLTADLKTHIGGGWSYLGKRYSDFNNEPALSHLEIPAYRTFEARAGLRSGRYSLELYGKNLGDERGVTNYYAGTTLFGVVNPAYVNLIRPRTIGLRFGADF